MSAAEKLGTLIDYIETELSSAYSFPLQARAADFLLAEGQFQSESGLMPRASVFVSQKDEDLELGIFLSPEIIEALHNDQPLSCLNMANLDAFCVLAEEVSHFHLLVNRANKSQGVSRLELEWQGEMDKLWLAGMLLRAQTGVSCFPQLARLILEGGQLASSEAHYADALRYARTFWKRLVLKGKTGAPECLRAELRKAYPLQWSHKLRLIHST